jgi:LuxR family maltose regulon positive regulatory protein
LAGTTLLTEWVTGCRPPVTWLSLGEGDNDPARLLAYFVAALQTIHKGRGESALAALQSPQPPLIEGLLAGMINQLVEVPDPFVIFRDDSHTIHNPAIQDALWFAPRLGVEMTAVMTPLAQ